MAWCWFSATLRERRQERGATAEQAALLELTQDSVFVIDMDGTVRFWSRGAEAMLGYSKSQAAGKISHDLLRTEFPQPLAEIRAELTARRTLGGRPRQDSSGRQAYCGG